MSSFFINKYYSALRAVLTEEEEEEVRAQNMRMIPRKSLNSSPIP